MNVLLYSLFQLVNLLFVVYFKIILSLLGPNTIVNKTTCVLVACDNKIKTYIHPRRGKSRSNSDRHGRGKRFGARGITSADLSSTIK